MTTNLLPISSDGGFVTGGNITTASYASPAPTLSGFSTISADNFRLMAGDITGGIATVVDDGINSIALAPGAQMDVYGFPFSQITRGQLTISGVATPSEVNGTWYYQSINTNTYQIYTDSTYSTLVDATGWSAYTGGGTVAIVKQVPAANIVINTNGYLTEFDNTGNLVLPAQGSITSPAGNLTIKASGETGDNPAVANSVIIKGGNTGTGDGGHIVLVSGSAPGAGGHAGNINITASNGQSVDGVVSLTTAGGDWVFDGNGVVTLPGEGVLRSIDDQLTLQSKNTSTGNINSVYLGTSGGLGFQESGVGNWLEIFRNGVDPEVSTPGNLLIRTDSANTSPTWKFDNTGNLTIPGSSGGMIKTVANGAIGITAINNGSDNPAQMMSWTVGQTNPNTIISTYASNALIQSNVNGAINTWKFDAAGNLTLPANTFSVNYANGVRVSLGGGNIANGNSNVNIATANGNVTIAAVGNTTMTVTGTGANITGTANISGNVSLANVTLSANTGQFNFNTTAYISGNANSLNRDGSILLSPYTGAGSNFAGVIIGGSGRLLSPGGSVHQIFNASDVTFQVAVKNITGLAATSTTSGALQITGGGGFTTNVYVGGSLVRTGAVTQTAWTTSGVGLKLPTATYTDNSTATGTQASSYVHLVDAPALAFSNSVTVTNAATMYVAAPTAGTNATLTNSWAMIANGNIQVNGTAGIVTPNLPAFRVAGSVSTSWGPNLTMTSTQGTTVDYNQGSYYDNTTGTFTAPVAGLYQVSMTARNAGNTTSISQLAVIKNFGSANTVQAFIEFAANSTMNHAGSSTTSKLAAGDTLILRVQVGTIQFDQNDSWSVAFLG